VDAFKASKEIRKEYYGTECPAGTWVQVKQLYLPKFVVTVDVVAVFPNG
jgi:enamine deaminase RidA (YjgF/YER057c/UK114 family)